MTDAQIVGMVATVGIAFIAVLMGVLLNNARLNDVKELLAAKIATSQSELRVLIEKNHSELMLKLAEMDNRLSRLESERRVIS